MVLIRVRRQRREDRRRHLGLIRREEPLVAEVVQRLVGVVAQEALDVLGPAERVVDVFGVLVFVLV